MCIATLAGRIFCGAVPALTGAVVVEGLQSGKEDRSEEARGVIDAATANALDAFKEKKPKI